jgi:hypothetical protein
MHRKEIVHAICFQPLQNTMSKVIVKNEKVLSDEHYTLKRIDFDIKKRMVIGKIKSEKYLTMVML